MGLAELSRQLQLRKPRINESIVIYMQNYPSADNRGQYDCTDVFFGHVLVPKSARIPVLQSEDTCRII
ncbi:hypothetical protein P5673_011002 [Acropora cervicornis]|uniref:Uncharacterized protein n=1 Tax=Acropora cervicornis TaxID=6130 RepID=A0AAD9QPM4_ACRCE|nr:hypothetical protein P5673_011002 [Acropora cervicornis]